MLKVGLYSSTDIIFSYYLPFILPGKAFDELYDAYDTGYNSDIDPTITNSFATAAFHFVNSLLDQDIEVEGNSSRLMDSYFKPEILAQKGMVQKLLKGMITQKSQGLDFNYDDDVSFGISYSYITLDSLRTKILSWFLGSSNF